MTDINDDILVQMYRAGDADAFDVLFDRHHRAVYNFAVVLLQDCHQAMDVLQETFLVLARKTAGYEAKGYFKTWLLRICRNRCFNILQTNKLRAKIVAESGFEILPPSTGSRPDDAAEHNEELAAVRAEIARLPDRQREAMAMYAFEDMKYKDIAVVMDLPLNTVKTLINRARQTLAVALRGKP